MWGVKMFTRQYIQNICLYKPLKHPHQKVFLIPEDKTQDSDHTLECYT